MKTLVKTSMKLLLRTKILWIFLAVMPILSTFLLKKNIEYTAYIENVSKIVELDDASDKVAYYGGKGEYVVKVYDGSSSELSNELLNNMLTPGLFTVCRADISDKTDLDNLVKECIESDGVNDRMGAAVYLHPDFDERIQAGDYAGAVTVYVLSDDKRYEAFENELKFQLAGVNKHDALSIAKEAIPEKNTVSVAGSDSVVLTEEQNNHKAQMGYAYAFLILGFLFCGFFIANNAIKEQKDGVLTRINLTKTTTLTYFISKFITVFIISLIMTGVTAVCSLFLNLENLGMSRIKFIAVIFMMGLIFSTLSMLLGIIMGDVMGASVATFTVYCISSLFGGVYFPIKHMSTGMKAVSSMMPQTWFLKGTEMIYAGDNKAFIMLLCITGAYLAVIISLGSLGLKVKKS